MKKILLFGAGKSATVLIDYLLYEAADNNWALIIADANRDIILEKTNHAALVEAIELDINNDAERAKLIRQADIVISMMPPSLHFFIARDCVEFGKNLLTASYVDPLIESLRQTIEDKKLLFLCEMGLDPGIDHMSAMKLLDEIRAKGGTITSFKSHCGGLVAPESDDNPWHYKISWNPRNVVMAGKAGAEYKLDNEVCHKTYKDLFKNCGEVIIDGLGKLACYPNRDSLNYMPVYKLENAKTFLRTTLRYPAFCIGWDAIVAADLANDIELVDIKNLTFKKWSSPIKAFINEDNKIILSYLGLFDDEPVPEKAITSADILQYLMEKKLVMQPNDKDMIVMLHEIEYIQTGTVHKIESCLVVKGTDNMRTAMAKTVGLPLGIAAKLILNGTIQLSGIHIPTSKEIYEPVLKELALAGICFTEKNRD
ncbi:saccharopine dehydrogenase C-terminal domain-containing protein [soil metagenome]